MIAPVLVHTAEEAFWSLPVGQQPVESVHLLMWPEIELSLFDEGLDAIWERLLEVREEVYRKIEDARQSALLGTSLEALVKVYAGGDLLELLKAASEQLPAFFIVSQVVVGDLSALGEERAARGDTEVIVERASGEKCQRCWNYNQSVGASAEELDLCERCVAALEEINR